MKQTKIKGKPLFLMLPYSPSAENRQKIQISDVKLFQYVTDNSFLKVIKNELLEK